MSKRRFGVKDMVMTGLFAAICFVVLFFKIPIPSPVGTPFLHLGNMFVILAALLFSGLHGGIAGSMGMGLFDLFYYPSSFLKTLILKFGIGIVTGFVASKGRKENQKSPSGKLLILSAILILTSIIIFIVTKNVGYEIKIENVDKSLVLIPLLYIFCFILGIILAVAAYLSKSISVELQYAILGASSGIIFNLIGEFIFAVISKVIAGSLFVPAIIAAAFSLPATLINGTFSVIGAIVIYIPLKRALKIN